jgi:hypothetical protein
MTDRPRRYPDRIRAIDGNYFLSADYIMRAGNGDGDTILGQIPPFARFIDRFFQVRGGASALSVDFGREGELAGAFNAVCQNALERLRASPVVRELLARSTWDRAGRERWEATLAQVIGDEFSKNPLFAQYRNVGQMIAGRIPVAGNVDLNGLTPEGRFACHEMSILHALAQQLVENHFLQPGGGSLRTRGQYYVALGTLTHGDDTAPGNRRHAWVVSSLTGNAIESTVREAPYQQGAEPNHSFDRVLAGYPVGFRTVRAHEGGQTVESVGIRTIVYNSGHDGSSMADTRARFRLRLFEMGQLAHADTLSGRGMLLTDYTAVNRLGLRRYRELNGYSRDSSAPSSGEPQAGGPEESMTLLQRWSHYLFGPRP